MQYEWISIPFYKGNEPEEWVITIGNFDGFHLGHQEIIRLMKANSPKNCGIAHMTFNPHPKEVLNPSVPITKIYDFEEKKRLCIEHGIDLLIVVPFTMEFSKMSPEDFLEYFIEKLQNIKKVFVGFDFNFGRDRVGDFEILKKQLSEKNIETVKVEPLLYSGEKVSSSLIRKLLSENNFAAASKLLGRIWGVRGKVLHGEKRGRLLGFPTANLRTDIKLPVKNGVYISKFHIEGEVFNSVTNVGIRPTIEGKEDLLIETHILDFDRDIYGLECFFEPISFIREEKKFNSLDELKAAIENDKKTAIDYFNSNLCKIAN